MQCLACVTVHPASSSPSELKGNSAAGVFRSRAPDLNLTVACLVSLQVSETAQEPIPEEKDNINAVHSLSQEATFINQNFSQQVVVKVRRFCSKVPHIGPERLLNPAGASDTVI